MDYQNCCNALPQISIVIPAYNEENYAGQTIESFLEMKHPIEIIFVDDGSTDDTAQIVKKYPVELIRVEHSGPAKAKNIGIKRANGELIVIHDANDTILDKNYLMKISQAYLSSRKRCDLIVVPTRLIPRRDKLLCKAIFVRDYLPYGIEMINGIPSTVIMRTAAFRNDFCKRCIRYDEGLGTCEDMFIRLPEETKIEVTSKASTMVMGGAFDSLSAILSRYIWAGKTLFATWKYGKKRVLTRLIYMSYCASSIIVIPLLLLFTLYSLLYLLPGILLESYRSIKVLHYTNSPAIASLVVFLDYTQGVSYFAGLIKATILKLLGKYSVAK